MVSNSDLARSSALVSLPLAAFLFGPAVDAIAPESIPGDLLLSLLPTVLPLAALVVVALVSYRRTGSTRRALRLTALSFAVGLVGAVGYLLHVWSEASGS